MPNTLTCVYCGMAYPEGTPPYGNKILTDHIKICPKHPLRKAEEKIIKLKTALSRLVGTTDKEELKRMLVVMSSFPQNEDVIASREAIKILIEIDE